MLNKVWFRTGIMLIILFVLIKLIMEVHVIFNPIIIIVKSVLLPFILSGFLFLCILRWQNFRKHRVPRWEATYDNIYCLDWYYYSCCYSSSAIDYESNQQLNLNKHRTYKQEAQGMIKYALDQMDKLPSDVTDRVNKVVKSFGDNVTNVLTNSISIVSQIISTSFILVDYGSFLLNLYVERP